MEEIEQLRKEVNELRERVAVLEKEKAMSPRQIPWGYRPYDPYKPDYQWSQPYVTCDVRFTK